MLHIKLTGKEAVALFQLLFVCYSPDVWITAFPVDKSHTSFVFILFRIQGSPEVGMIPYQGLQEELIRAEGIIESLQHKRFLAHHIFHACLRDAHPVGTLGKSIFWRCRNGMSSIERYLFSRLVMAFKAPYFERVRLVNSQ